METALFSHPNGCAKLQENSFNLISSDSEINIIQYLRRVVPRPEGLPFASKKA
jgi:hypothetical protein